MTGEGLLACGHPIGCTLREADTGKEFCGWCASIEWTGRHYTALTEAREALNAAVLLASATAHRVCCGTEHDPATGKLHGYCVVCGVPWPCNTAERFMALAAREGEGEK